MTFREATNVSSVAGHKGIAAALPYMQKQPGARTAWHAVRPSR